MNKQGEIMHFNTEKNQKEDTKNKFKKFKMCAITPKIMNDRN
jgi:hypothetical protein